MAWFEDAKDLIQARRGCQYSIGVSGQVVTEIREALDGNRRSQPAFVCWATDFLNSNNQTRDFVFSLQTFKKLKADVDAEPLHVQIQIAYGIAIALAAAASLEPSTVFARIATSPPMRIGRRKPVPQRVRWRVMDGGQPGLIINDGRVIPWNHRLRREMETKLLGQMPDYVSAGARVRLVDLNGREAYMMWAYVGERPVAAIYLGSDPLNGWAHDGLVRVGPVHERNPWHVFQRYSNGTYRILS